MVVVVVGEIVVEITGVVSEGNGGGYGGAEGVGGGRRGTGGSGGGGVDRSSRCGG